MAAMLAVTLDPPAGSGDIIGRVLVGVGLFVLFGWWLLR